MTYTITKEQLIAATRCKASIADQIIEPLNAALNLFEINNHKRAAAFIANVCIESGYFQYTRELWKVGKPTKWQIGYEGRFGNKMNGDGYKYRGAGWLQITFRNNFILVRDLVKKVMDCPDFEQEPDKLAEYPWAAISAGAWWKNNGLNELADREMITGIRRRINGPQMLGLPEVKQIWEHLLSELGK